MLAKEPLKHRLSCRNELGRQCCWELAYCTDRAFGPIPRFPATTNLSWQWRSFASDRLHQPADVLRRKLITKRKWNNSRTWMHMVGDSVMASTFRAMLLLLGVPTGALVHSFGSGPWAEYADEELRLTYHPQTVLCVPRPLPSSARSTQWTNLDERAAFFGQFCTMCNASDPDDRPEFLIVNGGLWDMQDRDAAACREHLPSFVDSLQRHFQPFTRFVFQLAGRTNCIGKCRSYRTNPLLDGFNLALVQAVATLCRGRLAASQQCQHRPLILDTASVLNAVRNFSLDQRHFPPFLMISVARVIVHLLLAKEPRGLKYQELSGRNLEVVPSGSAEMSLPARVVGGGKIVHVQISSKEATAGDLLYVRCSSSASLQAPQCLPQAPGIWQMRPRCFGKVQQLTCQLELEMREAERNCSVPRETWKPPASQLQLAWPARLPMKPMRPKAGPIRFSDYVSHSYSRSMPTVNMTLLGVVDILC